MSNPSQKGLELDSESGFSKNVLNTLAMSYRPFIGRILIVFLIGLIGRMLVLGNANLIGLWVDQLFPGQLHTSWLSQWLTDWSSADFVICLLSMSLIGFAMTLIFRAFFSRYSALAISSMYDEVTLRTSRFPQSYFDQNPVGRIITRFSNDYGNVFRLFGGPLAEFVSILFDLIMMTVLIAIASPWYLIAVAFIAILNYIVFRLNQNHLRQSRRLLSRQRSPSISHFAETTQGASTIRIFQKQKVFTEKFQYLDELFLNQKKKTVKSIVFYSFQMNSLSAVLLLVTGLAAIYLSEHGYVSVGSIGVAFGFIILSGNTIQMFFEWLSQIEDALIGVERLDQLLRRDTEPGHRLPSSAQFKTQHWVASPEEQANFTIPLTDAKSSRVSFKNVWFRYGPSLPWVLKGVSFDIQPAEKVGIIGRTGSGKSSLVQALYYLYPLDKGSIHIDDFEPQLSAQARGVDLQRFRALVSSISQDPILFQGTLRENLSLLHANSDKKIWQALDRVGLSDWLKNEPLGLQFRIEERGKNLSLGEKQLVCMARALLKNSPVVVMDEATASVDPQSEEILVKATEDFFKDRTQIIIAHRLSTLKSCDRVLWLDQGEIRMFDTPEVVIREFEKNHF